MGAREMDIETSEAIDRLGADIARVEVTLAKEFGNLRAEMATKSDLAGMATKSELAAVREELKSHTQILFEDLRGKIQIIAEGHDALNTKFDALDSKVDRLDRKFDRNFDVLNAKLDAMFDALSAKIERLLPPSF